MENQIYWLLRIQAIVVAVPCCPAVKIRNFISKKMEFLEDEIEISLKFLVCNKNVML